MNIGKRLKQAREERKITQEALGEKIGLQKAIISLYESDARRPSLDALEGLADALNVNMSYLLGESDMTIEEQDLVNHYRMASDAGKAGISAFAEAVAKGGM